MSLGKAILIWLAGFAVLAVLVIVAHYLIVVPLIAAGFHATLAFAVELLVGMVLGGLYGGFTARALAHRVWPRIEAPEEEDEEDE